VHTAVRNSFAVAYGGLLSSRRDTIAWCANLSPKLLEAAVPRTRPYPSDLSDKEWALLELLLVSPNVATVRRSGLPGMWLTPYTMS
jgi:hypothetical protein